MMKKLIVAGAILVSVLAYGDNPPVRGRGALVLTFDDPRYDDWIRQIPIFERYGAHATFFPCGHIGTNEVAKLKRLAAAGGGWRPFATREDFIRHLDDIKAAEDAGKVVVTADYTLKP